MSVSVADPDCPMSLFVDELVDRVADWTQLQIDRGESGGEAARYAVSAAVNLLARLCDALELDPKNIADSFVQACEVVSASVREQTSN